jgi:phenylalanyl-tRNA synthetase beta chain
LLFKGVLVALGRALNVTVALVASKHPWLHPGYQAELKVGNTKVGCFGLLHPSIKAERKYRFDHIVAEFNAHQLMGAKRDFTPLAVSDLPSIRRDITLGVGKRDWSQQVISCINGMKLEHLRDVSCVDSFEKDGEEFRRLTYFSIRNAR